MVFSCFQKYLLFIIISCDYDFVNEILTVNWEAKGLLALIQPMGFQKEVRKNGYTLRDNRKVPERHQGVMLFGDFCLLVNIMLAVLISVPCTKLQPMPL